MNKKICAITLSQEKISNESLINNLVTDIFSENSAFIFEQKIKLFRTLIRLEPNNLSFYDGVTKVIEKEISASNTVLQQDSNVYFLDQWLDKYASVWSKSKTSLIQKGIENAVKQKDANLLSGYRSLVLLNIVKQIEKSKETSVADLNLLVITNLELLGYEQTSAELAYLAK